MRRKQSSKSNRLFLAVKKAVKAIGLFFAECLFRLKNVFRRSKPYIRTDSVSDETQVFEDGIFSESGYAVRKKEKPQRSREMPYISKEHLSGEGKEHINMFTSRRHAPNFIVGIILTSFKLALIVIFMIGAAGFGTLIGVAKAYMDTTPTLNTAEIENQAETSYIYDSNGDLITPYTGSENRDWASIDEIPQMLQDAVVSIEDVRFYYHSGVDVKRLAGVFLSNLMNDNVQGGSTITQQLVKISLLSPERTYKRKIQEAYLAMQLESKYTKTKILEAYLNTIPLGASNYGVKAAAMDYFGKSLDELSLRECAMLAGITNYPYAYNPRRCFYVTKDTIRLNERTDNVLMQMYKAGYITKQQYDDALKSSVYVLPTSTVNEMYEMPYFVEYAIYDVITHLLKERGLQDTAQNRAAIDQELRTQGYRIYTTVDPSVQKTVEQTLAEWTNYPKLENKNDSVIRSENKDGSVTEVIQPQASVVVVDQRTGQLKAVVGGRTTPTAKKTLNRAYQTTMPVGSSIKPIAVYAPALDKGYSDGTVVPNLPVPIEGWDSENGYPGGGSSLYGPVTLRTAIVNSLNSATAYTLLNNVGLEDSYNYLIQMGINPSHISMTGSGLALGTSGITPIEMAGAYATIANGGLYLEPLSFTQVKDRDGNVILDADSIRVKHQVFSESTAWLITDMLQNAVQEGTGKKAKIPGMNVGGKTGTNQNVKGVFFAGITPYYTSTLWIGQDYYKALDKSVYASDAAAPLWKAYMSKILDGKNNMDIIDASPESLGLVRLRICSVSGMLATDACEHDAGGHKPVDAWFVKGTEPTDTCNVHVKYSVCSESSKIATQYCPDEHISVKGLAFLPADSIYWKLTSQQLAKYLPGAFLAPEGFTLSGLTSDMPNYSSYFCNIHTQSWYDEQKHLSDAIAAAKSQINASKAVLADPSIALSMEDRDALSSKIHELESLVSAAGSTAGAIEQKTAELKTLTDNIIALYGSGP